MAPNLRTTLRYAKRGADIVGVLLFLGAFAGFIVQVFFRYVLGDPLTWTEEAVVVAFMWSVFWAAAFMVPIREHVTFDVVYDTVSPRRRRMLALASMAVVLASFVLLVPYTWDYLDFLMRKKSPVLRIPMTWIYGCYLLFVVAFAIQAGWRIAKLLGPEWRRQI